MSQITHFVAALVGGAVVAAVLLLTGAAGGDETKTVFGGADLANPKTGALTPREIYKRDAPGVVFVTADVTQAASPFGTQQRGQATGSGFVIGKGGSIVTNAHVVEGATRVSVRFGDSKRTRARVAGRDPSTDLALLLVDPGGLDLHPLDLGSSKGIQVGDPTVAIGNPFGLDRTLTTGVVSALQRSIPSLQPGFSINDVIQTDAAINPGNSGGPLIDPFGKVIGVNSQIETGGGGSGNVGIGFAVPIDTAKEVIPQLRKSGTVERAYLGVSTSTVGGGGGARVERVEPGSPAARAGIREGDVIRRVEGERIDSNAELSAAIERRKPGSVVTIELLRGAGKRSLDVKLGDRGDILGGR
jgi:S1-C subfamily serine protease